MTRNRQKKDKVAIGVSNARIHRRQALIPPLFGQLAVGVRKRLIDASGRLPEVPLITAEVIERVSSKHFKALEHELSDAFVALNQPQHGRQRSTIERQSLEWLVAQSGALGALGAEAFAKRLGILNRKIVERSGWRTGIVRLRGDVYGAQIEFPAPKVIPAQLERIRAVLMNPDEAPALFVAVSILALLVNCHPFVDGNGRVGRILFNYALRAGGLRTYIPFYEIAGRSRGGYEIALRYAELHGDWAPLMTYAVEVVEASFSIASSIDDLVEAQNVQ